MPKPVDFNGKSFQLPLTGEEAQERWQAIVDFLSEVPGATFNKNSGLFELLSEVDFGGLHGVRALYWKSRSGNEANTGTIRLAKSDFLAFRNEANNADVTLGKDSEDFLTFNNQRLLVDPTTQDGDMITRNGAGVLVRQDREALRKSFDNDPLGKIISVDSRFAAVPATGEISAEGYALCNGQALPAGHELSTSETNLPDLTDNRYLKGSSSSGSRAGSNTTTLTDDELPAHTHGRGTYTAAIKINGSKPSLTGTTTFAASGHTHNSGSYTALWKTNVGNQDMWYYLQATENWTSHHFKPAKDGGNHATVNHNEGVRVVGYSGQPSHDHSVGIKDGDYTLTSSRSGESTLSQANKISGDSGSTGSGSSFSNEPKYHTVVYLMKVKKV